jgi:hypothetical protein
MFYNIICSYNLIWELHINKSLLIFRIKRLLIYIILVNVIIILFFIILLLLILFLLFFLFLTLYIINLCYTNLFFIFYKIIFFYSILLLISKGFIKTFFWFKIYNITIIFLLRINKFSKLLKVVHNFLRIWVINYESVITLLNSWIDIL